MKPVQGNRREGKSPLHLQGLWLKTWDSKIESSPQKTAYHICQLTNRRLNNCWKLSRLHSQPSGSGALSTWVPSAWIPQIYLRLWLLLTEALGSSYFTSKGPSLATPSTADPPPHSVGATLPIWLHESHSEMMLIIHRFPSHLNAGCMRARTQSVWFSSARPGPRTGSNKYFLLKEQMPDLNYLRGSLQSLKSENHFSIAPFECIKSLIASQKQELWQLSREFRCRKPTLTSHIHFKRMWIFPSSFHS